MPVFLPQRIDDELCEMLEKYHPLWINLHFNHPNEITPEVSRAVDKLTKAGLPVGNQSVLLAGVNDCVHIQRALVHKLVANRIRPYYLYQCDLVEGSGHFRTPVGKGLEIMEGLRGHTSGYAVPTFVIDAPGGGGKIPVMPNYLISYSDHKVVLRNYEGYITTYEEPRDLPAARPDGLRVLPARAAGGRAVRDPRTARGRADVDRAEGLLGGPHPRQHRGAPTPGPLEVGAVRRRRDRGHRERGPAGPRGRRSGGERRDHGLRAGRGTATARGRADRIRARRAALTDRLRDSIARSVWRAVGALASAFSREKSAANLLRWWQLERPEAGQSGILGLLEGERMWIEPKGFSEVHTRGNTEAHRLQDPSKWVPFGVGAIEGTASEGLPVLEAGDPASNGATTVYAPGEEPRPREGEPTGSAHGELL